MLQVHYSTVLEADADRSVNFTLRKFQEQGFEIKELKHQIVMKQGKQAFPDIYVTTMIIYDDKQPIRTIKVEKRT